MSIIFHIDDFLPAYFCILPNWNFCFSHTGLGKNTTREDQVEMIYIELMCLIFGWNSVIRYDFNCGFMHGSIWFFYSCNAFLLCHPTF